MVLFFRLRRYCIAALLLGGLLGLSQAQTPQRTVLVLGDSLSAEYGLARGTGWVTLLEQRLAQEKPGTRVVNASISGETTFGGRSRLAALLAQHKPTHVILELGGNDALRGLSLDATRANLEWMTQQSKKAGAKVLLLGMQMPPNYGADYAKRFEGLYTQVARAEKVGLVPFFLKGVADGPEPTRLFQPDRIHPTAEAQPLMLGNVWPELKKLL
ncbi:MAG: arylesterase [Hylemonella sp.]|uniref:arylesterase n=1 Tax=Hylemonella sp. TaxID=2066020 RepID=UPI0022CABFBD|nr:arylesterase [Hylemonella sp.]MCZ8251664.1 arylesterase [Hylemonella sp.]